MDGNQAANQQQAQDQAAQNTQSAPQIDYEKLAQIVTGKQQATEDSVLKGYFKQQGLSQEEMTQAINAFKAQKAAQTPDVGALQTQLATAQQQALAAQLQSAATLEAVKLGIDPKTIPYVLRVADFSQAVDKGQLKADAITNALNKVLEDVPAFKAQAAAQKGFVQVGTGGSTNSQNTATETDELKKAFGL